MLYGVTRQPTQHIKIYKYFLTLENPSASEGFLAFINELTTF